MHGRLSYISYLANCTEIGCSSILAFDVKLVAAGQPEAAT